jgi:hypothetical protein
VVGNDVPRTFPDRQKQQGGDGFDTAELQQVLSAKVVAEAGAVGAADSASANTLRPSAEGGVGYAQGMADIAAVLLEHLPPRSSPAARSPD